MNNSQDFPHLRERIAKLEKERTEVQDECVWLQSENKKLQRRVQELEKGGSDKWKSFTFILLFCLLVCGGLLWHFGSSNGSQDVVLTDSLMREVDSLQTEISFLTDSMQQVVDSLQAENSSLQEKLVDCENKSSSDEEEALRNEINKLKYKGYTPEELYSKWKKTEKQRDDYKKQLQDCI